MQNFLTEILRKMNKFIDELELFFKRKSVRNFLEKAVEKEKLDAVLEAARWAPSTQNRQPWEFIIADDPQYKAQVLKHSGFTTNTLFLKKAPILIIGLSNMKKDIRLNGMDYYLVDFAIAMEHIVLAATQLGLGTCWLAWYNEKKLKKFLELPEHIRIVAMSPLGYPKDKRTLIDNISKLTANSKKRKKTDDFIFYNGYKK